MLALLHDPEAEHGLRLGEAPGPEPRPSEVLVRVAATSLNFGEVAFLARNTAPGGIAGCVKPFTPSMPLGTRIPCQ